MSGSQPKGSSRSKRLSVKWHGRWVRHKVYDWVGQIAYYDRKTELVWIVWKGGKTISASGEKKSDLVWLKSWGRQRFWPRYKT